MMDKPVMFLMAKILTVIASYLVLSESNADMVTLIISALSFACVFFLEVLLFRIFKNKMMLIVTISLSMMACFFLGMAVFFPLFIILLLHLFDLTIDKSMFYQIFSVSFILALFILEPGTASFALTFILIILLMFCRRILGILHLYIKKNEEQKEVISELHKKQNDLKSLIKTLKYTASVEERNRIAARIHDQIGHGISGSIIMLEAAMLIMKKDTEKATNSIEKAISNLREGVDEIRTALREERAGRYLLGINDVTALLEEFKVSYNKATELRTVGDLDLITIDMWACIHDNLKECLTNVLKHSNATEFILSIEVFNKIIKVVYKDNGRTKESFEKGIGLEAIEERTVNCKGRCFFSKNESGFSVTNIFTY